MSVCHVFVPLRKTRLPVDWTLLIEEHISYIGMPLELFGFLLFWCFYCFLREKNLVLGSLQTRLLCIMAEIPGGGSVAVAVAVRDRWQVTISKQNLQIVTQVCFHYFYLLEMFTNSAPLCRVGHRVAMSVCLGFWAIGCSFFARPLIGPEITWLVPNLSLLDPPPPKKKNIPTLQIGSINGWT